MFERAAAASAVVAVLAAVTVHSSGGAGPERSYAVKPGDTLWSIAARHYAGDLRAAVWEISRRNQLAGTTIYLGERLVLP